MNRYHALMRYAGQLVTLVMVCALVASDGESSVIGQGARHIDDALQAVASEGGAADVSSIDTASEATFSAPGQATLQVVGAAMLGETVLVADASSFAIDRFARDGRFVSAIGRYGRGPGEFEEITSMRSANGDVFVEDARLHRVSEFKPGGQSIRAISIQRLAEYSNYSFEGAFGDGSLCYWALAKTPLPPMGTSRLLRQTAVLFRVRPDGSLGDSIGVTKTAEIFVQPSPTSGQMWSVLPFGRTTQAVVGGDRVYVIQNDDDRIHVINKQGRQERALTRPRPAVTTSITREDVEVVRARFVHDGTRELQLDKVFDNLPLPRSFPAYGWAGPHKLTMLRRTSTGELWALEFGGVRSQRPMWEVYDSTGRLRGRVGAATEMDVLDATTTHVLIKTWNAAGSERVELRVIHWRSMRNQPVSGALGSHAPHTP